MIPTSTGGLIAGTRGLSTIGDRANTGNLTDVPNTTLGENIAEQIVNIGSYIDSTLVLGDGGHILVTVTEVTGTNTSVTGAIVVISRKGTSTNVQTLAAGVSLLTVSCSTATGYKVRISNGTAGALYCFASIARIQ
jgi:hypothetical protein